MSSRPNIGGTSESHLNFAIIVQHQKRGSRDSFWIYQAFGISLSLPAPKIAFERTSIWHTASFYITCGCQGSQDGARCRWMTQNAFNARTGIKFLRQRQQETRTVMKTIVATKMMKKKTCSRYVGEVTLIVSQHLHSIVSRILVLSSRSLRW